jgi:hypothetical protein
LQKKIWLERELQLNVLLRRRRRSCLLHERGWQLKR